LSVTIRAALSCLALCTLAPLLGACSGNADEDGLPVVVIGEPESIFEDGLRLSSGAQLVRDATSSGIVALNAQGEVVPGLGESWIVTDDGRSFIFRLRQVRMRAQACSGQLPNCAARRWGSTCARWRISAP